MSGRFSNTPLVDYDDDAVSRAADLHRRADILVKIDRLPADYRRQVLTLADLRKLVESAEQKIKLPDPCDMSRITTPHNHTSDREDTAHLARYGW